MEKQYDYRKFAIVYVDDEEKSLKAFARAFGDEFRIYTATNARDGAKLIEEKKDEIAVLMTDQRMPGENGNWLLQETTRIQPRIVRMLATAYTDFDDAVTAINDGGIFHYVNKPWDPAHLEAQLRRAMEFFLTQRENEQLAQEKLEALRNLMVADRLVSLGLLAGGLSHHIRNQLVAINTFLELAPSMMQDEKAEPKAIRHGEFWTDYRKKVLDQIDKTVNLLEELRTASEKPATQTTERVNLPQLVSETIAGLNSSITAKNITITNEIPAGLPEIVAERDQFYRLFDLLLKEELVSLPDGSKITFAAQALNDLARPQVRILITDNGPGLSAEKLQCLFDPFMVRADAPSEYGIHLMRCFFIVHHHGGRIEATSAAGKGTTFTLHLPITPASSLDELNQGILHKSRLAEQVWGGVRPSS